MVNKILIILLLLISSAIQAATYYVSNSGNDANSGLTTELAWASISKVNATTFSAGDQILFQRGDTFYGSFIINQAGTSGNPITIGAYGTGANPVITGFTTVTAWTNLGGNIWESTAAVSTLSSCNMVLINGVNTAMGRYPNSDATWGGYLPFQSYSGKTSITSSSLTGTPNWTGAEVAVRTTDWSLERRTILTQSTSTLTYSTTTYTPANNRGFFIQNDPRTLDKQNEWYYNPTTHKLQVYSTTQPSNVKLASIDKLITASSSYITIENLSLTGANTYAVYNYADGTRNLSIINCEISYSGQSGIWVKGSRNLIDGCTITDSNDNGINFSYGHKRATVRNCTVLNSGVLLGMGIDGGYSGISLSYHFGATIENNKVINTGFNGITTGGDSVMIKNNFVDIFCFNLQDGSGIYLNHPNNPYGVTITGNVVLNGIGAVDGLAYSNKHAHGIYIDFESDNYNIINNSIAHCSGSGINAAEATYTDIQYNTIFDCTDYSINLYGSVFHPVRNNTITNNILVAKTLSQKILKLSDKYYSYDISIGYADFDYNVYARPLDDYANKSGYNYQQNAICCNWLGGELMRSIEQWQAYSGKDLHSTKSPYTIASESELTFVYNAETTAQVKTLPFPAKEIDGTEHYSSITLQPYTSAVLFRDDTIQPPVDPPVSNYSGRGAARVGSKVAMYQGKVAID